eukprot:TRINITY_DN7404_c0_g2_i1.p1 TRINITY_DN7404_c0_g2~~TRINITY_DN7404_c0_g2_i1.p1  ORF type:complete len:341 (+),score=39.02 TRINITY_DN7404_c0_g2_i1:126-1148(+)
MQGRSVRVFQRLYSVAGVSQAVQSKPSVSQELAKQLTILRERVGKAQEKSPKTVLSDKDVENIVNTLPHNLNDLKQIKNIGDQKIKLIGKDVISLIKNLENKSRNQQFKQNNVKTESTKQQQGISQDKQQSLQTKLEKQEINQQETQEICAREDENFSAQVGTNNQSESNKPQHEKAPLKEIDENSKFSLQQKNETESSNKSSSSSKLQKTDQYSKQMPDENNKQISEQKVNMKNEKQQNGENHTGNQESQLHQAKNLSSSGQFLNQKQQQSESGQFLSQNEAKSDDLGKSDQAEKTEYYSPRIEFQNGDAVHTKKDVQNSSFLKSVWSNIGSIVKKVTG